MNEAVSVDSATKIVDRIPRPGMEEPLESAIHELTQAAMRFPGHLGVTVMRPSPPSQPGFRLIYKFDSSEHMRAWEDSAEQHRLVENANRYTQGEPRYRRLSGLEAWFTLPASAPSTPPKGKMTFVSWVGIFPLVYIFGLAVNGVLPKGTPGVIRVLVVTALVVPTMSYVVGPWLTRVLKAWLFRSAKPN
jgi:uncharacterized protein